MEFVHVLEGQPVSLEGGGVDGAVGLLGFRRRAGVECRFALVDGEAFAQGFKCRHVAVGGEVHLLDGLSVAVEEL